MFATTQIVLMSFVNICRVFPVINCSTTLIIVCHRHSTAAVMFYKML